MRVYVETNFLLEVVLEQAEVAHAEQLIDLAAAAAVELVVPAVLLAGGATDAASPRS